MVRNNRRKAFTIVELVIVIAVIAILAAVMIPTFTGIIKRANISADEQLAASINTQLSIYKAEGNKIETEADLINALKSDADFTAQLNPKSAKHGYHYWYNAETQTVKLMANEDALETVQQQSLNAGGNGANVGFAHASPRSIVPGLYFLDQIGENENVIAEAFDTLAKMSTKTKADYQNAIAALNTLAGARKDDNKALAQAVLDRLAKTAVMTDKGAFINTNGNSINYIYIPAVPEGTTDYYLSHTVNHASSEEVSDLLDLVDIAAGSVIEIPENVKVAEGSLVDFGAITVLVDVEGGVINLKNVFSADAVANTATVRVNGADYTVNGKIVSVKGGNKVEGADLLYKNPVTNFKVSATADSHILSNRVALDGIKNAGFKLAFAAADFEAHEADPYELVEWSIVENLSGVSIDANGVVEFDLDAYQGLDFTVRASAVAVNEVEVNIDTEITVVKFDSLTVKFDNETPVTFDKDGKAAPEELFIGITTDANDNINTNASFGKADEFVYNYGGVSYTIKQLEQLNVNPTVTITTNNNYFNLAEDGTFNFRKDTIKALTGGIANQGVTFTLADTTGEYSGSVSIKVKDNTFAPYASAIPDYLNDYVYHVGTSGKVSFSTIFVPKTNVDLNEDALKEHKVYIFASEADGDGYFWDVVDSYNLGEDLYFSKCTPNTIYYVVLGFAESVDQYGKPYVSELETVSTIVQLKVVDGKNVTTVAEFNGGTGDDNVSRVLHADLSGFGSDVGNVLTLNGKHIYGNYYTINASTVRAVTNPGKSFISITNGSINQVILNGPVYERGLIRALDDADMEMGFFYFGIAFMGKTGTVNDSYLFGFNATTYVDCDETFNANDTIFEGGSLANVYIRQVGNGTGTQGTVNFNNVKMIQNRESGYKVSAGMTKDKWNNTHSIGVGFFVHTNQTAELILNLVNTEQYNWFCANDLNKAYADSAGISGGIKYDTKHYVIPILSSIRFKDLIYVSEALKEIFNTTDSTKKELYATFMHKVGDVNYINAAIIALDMNAIPAITITDTDSCSHKYYEGAVNMMYDLAIAEIGLGGKAWTYKHGDADCCSSQKVNYYQSSEETLAKGEFDFDTFKECVVAFKTERGIN